MILDGFKFGMLLQLAIGPVCIFIVQMSALKGFCIGEIGVFGVALVDGLFIIIAILGISSIIDRKKTRMLLKICGGSITFAFGLSTILSQFHIYFLSNLSIVNISNSNNVFACAVIITASNPLTIIFWAGIFSAKLTEENLEKRHICLFGFGALLSTICFLTMIAFIGSFAKAFLPTSAIQILNIIVGFLLIYFGTKIILKKDS